MDELRSRLDVLEQKVERAWNTLKLDDKAREIAEIEPKTQQPDFWSDQEVAQRQTRRLADLKRVVEPWQSLRAEIAELKELTTMADEGMDDELSQQVEVASTSYEALEHQLKFNGPYDDHNAILTIQAGAGGTDAQDWVQILQRMYSRWAQKHEMKVSVEAESVGEEAGLKNTTLIIEGDYAFGRLRSEHGVHRLVRLSPFNTANSRETSFAMVEVTPVIDEPTEVEIDESDLKIDVFRAGGHGGQSVNTTDSAVRITHIPTGIVVSIQNERSQIQNKDKAMNILRSKLAQLAVEQHAEKVADLRGPNIEAAWGNQIRNYVLHPYNLVKDTRTGAETSNVDAVLDGDIDQFIEAYLLKEDA